MYGFDKHLQSVIDARTCRSHARRGAPESGPLSGLSDRNAPVALKEQRREASFLPAGRALSNLAMDSERFCVHTAERRHDGANLWAA